MTLDQVIQDNCMGFSVKEEYFFDKRAAFESQLVEVISPTRIWRIAEDTSEGQIGFLQGK